MYSALKQQLQETLETSLKMFFLSLESAPAIDLEIPNDKKHGDFSCNVALKSAKILKEPPIVLAEKFCKAVQESIGLLP